LTITHEVTKDTTLPNYCKGRMRRGLQSLIIFGMGREFMWESDWHMA